MSRERIAYNPQSYLGSDVHDIGPSFITSPQPKRAGNCTFLCDFSDYDRVADVDLSVVSMAVNFSGLQKQSDGTQQWTANDHTVTMAGNGSRSYAAYDQLYVSGSYITVITKGIHYNAYLTLSASGSGNYRAIFGFMDDDGNIIQTSTQFSGSAWGTSLQQKTISLTLNSDCKYVWFQVYMITNGTPVITNGGLSLQIETSYKYAIFNLSSHGLTNGDRISILDGVYKGTWWVSYVNNDVFLIAPTRGGTPQSYIQNETVKFKLYNL